jgi:hypothetical protein
MLLHAALVRTLADGMGLPVVFAKLVSDVCVFTFGQLLLLRFFVFPVRRALDGIGGGRTTRWDIPEAGRESPVVRAG